MPTKRTRRPRTRAPKLTPEAEAYVASIFASDGLSDEEFIKVHPGYEEWNYRIPGLDLSWNPLAWVWRRRHAPPPWMVAQRENFDEPLELLQLLHAEYMTAKAARH